MAEATAPPVAQTMATPASASSASAAVSGDLKLKMPIQIAIPNTKEESSMGGLKSYTAYCITVNDFGRVFSLEKRFDDFAQLHLAISAIDRNLPPMPEKKMFASTDESVVAERRPAFEKMLRYMLRSEEIACEQEKIVWKFLELPLPATVAARYVFKTRRLQYLKQVGKLLDDKYLQEHAYRLCHDSILKTNLFLLSPEGNLGKAVAEVPEEGAEGYPASPAKAGGEANIEETLVIEMVQHAVQGGEAARKTFLEEDGLSTMWKLQLRIAQSRNCSAPDDRIKKVLVALIQGEGDQYAQVFAGFLKAGGVMVLAGFQDLCKQYAAFSEFIGKALWHAWDVETQRAFLEGDESGGGLALGLLGAIFGCGTKLSQILAGLLLSSLIANDLFADNRDRESQAAQGISGVLEELLVSMPTFTAPRKLDGSKGSGGASEDAAEAFIATLGRNEKAFARILKCVGAPCLRDAEGVAHHESAVWSAGSFGLWCLLKTKPKPARVAELRRSIPLLAQYGSYRARWLTGELLLHLHCEESKNPDDAGIGAEASGLEQNAVEVALSEQMNSACQQLNDSHQQNQSLMAKQTQLVDARQQSLAVGPDGDVFVNLQKALSTLMASREKLAKASSATSAAEEQGLSALDTLHKSWSTGDANADPELQRSLEKVQGIEFSYKGKKAELEQSQESLKWQSSTVEQSRNDMEESDGAVSATRKRITEMELELSTKQREAQQQRTLASSDLSSRRTMLTSDTEEIDQKLGKLREKAQKLQAGEPGQPPPDAAKVQETMGQLKQEAAKLKSRRAEIQAELSKASVDPVAAQDAAERLEQESNGLHDQLNFVRSSELQELERSHVARREAWQQETGRLQEIRSLRDSLERECNDLKRQLDEQWRVWRPLWSSRLNCWHERASALGEAQVCHHRFSESVSRTWDVFQEEESVRGDVLTAVANVQDTLSALSQQLEGIGVLQ